MATKALVGGVSPEGEHILKEYLAKFSPDTVIEPLKSVGIKGTMRNKAVRPDVILVILDDNLWGACYGVVNDVLELEKVHKYSNDEELTRFLIRRFGKLDTPISSIGTGLSDNSRDSISGYSAVKEEETDTIVVETTQTEVVSSPQNDAKIAELQDKLAQSELLVKNLTSQLADSQNAADLAPFIDKIKALEQSLAEKEAELQNSSFSSSINTNNISGDASALAVIEQLKTEIKGLKDDCADLEFQRNKAESEKNFIESEYTKLKSEVDDLRATRDKLEEVTRSLSEMTAKCAELESANSDANVLQSKIEEQNAVLSDLDGIKSDLNQKELDIQNLQVDLETKTKKVDDLTTKLNDLSALIDEKDTELQKKQEEITNLTAEKEETDRQNTELTDKISELQANLNELNVSLEQKSTEIATLEQENTDTMSKLEADAKLQDVLAESKQAVRDLQNTVNELNTTIAIQEGKLTAYETRNNQMKAEKERNTEALAQAQKEKEELTLQISELTKKVAQGGDATQSGDYAELESKNKKLENEIAQLRSNLADSQGGSEIVTQLNNELLEERRKNARISAELDVYRSGGEVINDSDNIIEVNKLKKEIENLKAELENRPEGTVGDTGEDIQELKQKCADLEMELVEKDGIVNEYESGIFGQLANVALPKVAYDIKVLVPEKLKSKCIVTASGSLESNLALYQNLKRTCVTMRDKSYLIVDLVTDTSIDMAFGITRIQSPIKWLTGEQPYQAFMADTKVPNVKVLSTGLAYLNDLSLLSVDWVSRIEELQNQFDVVIFNVGCLNNFVAKILFGSFTKIMLGHIVVKATPINLRTIILILTGYNDKRSLGNVIVSCANFDSSASCKALYQKLVSKCQAQILKDSDVLTF